MIRARALVVAVLLLAAATTGTGPAAAAPVAPGSDGLAVTGYALGSASDALVTANAPALTTLTVDGVLLRRGGVTASTADMRRLLATAHAQGLRAELLVSNYSEALGDFDSAAASRLLRSPARVEQVADALAATVRAEGWDGVNVDLESLRRGDGPGLVALLAALRTRLPAPLGLSIDVQASTTPRGYLRGGYRLAEVASLVDVVQLMAYDRHGPGWSGPGPIGPLRWQRRSLDALLTQVPAAQVDLGTAGYGYTWPRRGTGRSTGVERAHRLVARDGVAPRWRPAAGEWTARLDDGTRLWWSDARSLALRRQLTAERGLHGLALWRLGSADTVTP